MLCLCCVSAIADDVTVMLSGPDDYEVLAMSKNGKYVVLYSGSDGALWDTENNTITYLGEDNLTTYVQCVSNDGTVAGEFGFENIDDETSGTTVTGGLYKDGEFIPLLDEDGNWIQSTAYGISPNGEYVCGCIWISSYKVAPALWNSDGTMIWRLAVEDGQTQGQAVVVNDDGVAGGWYYHTSTISGTTNRMSCYWTTDNEIVPVGLYDEYTDNSSDVSGLHSLTSMSENCQYALAIVGVASTDSLEDEDLVTKGIVVDLTTGEQISICSNAAYQVLDDGSVMFNVYADSTGVNESYMLTADGDSIAMCDYIEEEYGSSLDDDLDPHVFTGYMSEDKNIFAGTSYYADGSSWRATCWISNENEYADVRNLSARTLPKITDKVLLRWDEPIVNYDDVENYTVYASADTRTDWEEITDVEADYNLSAASLPTTTAVDTIFYKVVANYSGGTSEGQVTYVLTSDFETGYAEAPADVYGYNFNYNDVALKWTPGAADASANVGLYTGDLNIPFGANTEMTYQAGVLYDREIIGCYSEDYQLTGVQLYFNTAVDSLSLLIYEGEDIVVNQTIDQSELSECSFNVITLDEPYTLPSGEDVMVVFRAVQSDYGTPFELDEGPAVEGGDMLSEDDGATWTTMRELSENVYDYNFVISMMLTDGNNPTSTGYQLYRDGEAIATVSESGDALYEYIDNAVDLGNRTYTVETQWSDGSTGSSDVTISVLDRAAERCPAPVNVEAALSNDSTEMTITWEMPRQAEVTYSNWSYRGMGETISGMSGWFQGIQYTAQKMKSYAGGEITRVSFYPISDCDFAIHIYEDDEEVGYMEVESYTLNTMNIVTLDEPVAVKAGSEYIIAIEGFDVAEDEAFLGNDDGSISGYNVYSEDGESYYTDSYQYGNYMIGMYITLDGDNDNADITYNVNIDDEAVATGLDALTYTEDVSEYTAASVVVNVDAVYPIGESTSDDVTVDLLNDTGISNVTVDGGISVNNGIISIAGGADKACLYSVNGQTMYSDSDVETIDMSGLVPGVYILKTVTDGKTSTVKVNVTR